MNPLSSGAPAGGNASESLITSDRLPASPQWLPACPLCYICFRRSWYVRHHMRRCHPEHFQVKKNLHQSAGPGAQAAEGESKSAKHAHQGQGDDLSRAKPVTIERQIKVLEHCLPICGSASRALEDASLARIGETNYRSVLAKVEESGLFSEETREKLQLVEELLPVNRKTEENSQAENLTEMQDESGAKNVGQLLDESRQTLQFAAGLESQLEQLVGVARNLERKPAQ
ncbi:MAG: hypothetical protein OXC07_13305 [Kistimonas sp.]|nr:hypothetical protein [Kistimonas sp.]